MVNKSNSKRQWLRDVFKTLSNISDQPLTISDKPWTICAKISILTVWQGSEYPSLSNMWTGEVNQLERIEWLTDNIHIQTFLMKSNSFYL